MRSASSGYFAPLLGVTSLIFAIACQPAINSNANTNANANQAANTNSANTNMESNAGPLINTREPDKYSATLTFTLQTESNERAIGIPPLAVKVARNGDDRRVEFNLPDGSPLVYLDHDNHSYVIVPSRKQYAELTKEATGVQPQKLMTPGQLVESLKNVKGVQRVGDETINGRATAIAIRTNVGKFGRSERSERRSRVGRDAGHQDRHRRIPVRPAVRIQPGSTGEDSAANRCPYLCGKRIVERNAGWR